LIDVGMVVKPVALAGWRNELEQVQDRLGELFVRPEPRQQAGFYLEALLSSAERKNGWQLAEQIGDARPWRTQRVLSDAVWSQDRARALCRSYVIEHLGAPDGVLVVDETGFLKKGTQSVGVARQYTGTAGRIENSDVCCQYLEETGFTSALRGDPDRSRCHCALQETEPFRRRLITL
jgi:SRSO17 transposase